MTAFVLNFTTAFNGENFRILLISTLLFAASVGILLLSYNPEMLDILVWTDKISTVASIIALWMRAVDDLLDW